MKGDLQNKVVVITGAGRGLGQAVALGFAKEGAKLFLTTTNPKRAEKTISKLSELGAKAVLVEMDITNENSIKNMADAVIKHYGKVDILVNNAAVWYGLNVIPWNAMSINDWDRIFDVNVRSTWLCCKAIAPLMIKNSHGKIINIASTITKGSMSQYFLAYACSKSSIYTLTVALSYALGPSGINVNGIAPGYTATEASLGMNGSEEFFKGCISAQSIKRREEPSDIVGAVVFLASDKAEFITGQVISIDGGITT